MDWKSLLINQLIGLASGFLLMPKGAAKYLAVLLRLRDYLNLLIPPAMYPAKYTAADFNRTPEELAIPQDTATPTGGGGKKR